MKLNMHKLFMFLSCSILFSMMAFLTGCGQALDSEFVEIKPNETAFLIALDGAGQTQAKLNSVDYLEHNKVQAKRVEIPHKNVNICPNCIFATYKDLPTVKLITIDRTPVTREWTNSTATGTTPADQAFHVESAESIDFAIGGTITAHIEENDAAKFLYYYSGVQLADVIDNNVRSFLAASLSKQFGTHKLSEDVGSKAAFFAQAQKEAQDFFSGRGITIDNFGFTQGMTYTDAQIQDAINKNFVADTQVKTAQDLVQAAKIQAEAGAAVQGQQDLIMRQRALDIQQKAVDKWDGHLPSYMGSQGLPFITASTPAAK